MREIKYRAWHKENKIMYYNVQNAYDTMGQDIEPEDIWTDFSCVIDEAEKGILELMQYTGLKDKNGKEIYEGDIVQFDYHRAGVTPSLCHPKGVVEWDNEDSCYRFARARGKPDNCKIIGNIYENKDLLK